MVKKGVGFFDHLSSVLALPVTATVIIPLILLFMTSDYSIINPNIVIFGVMLTGLGSYFIVVTILLLAQKGKGTLAPWNPTKILVTNGLYEHVRNPMITGATIILLGESIMLNSLTLIAWTAMFFALNHTYITRIEEPHLRKKHGKKYEKYHKNTPRWIPKRK